MFWEIVTLLVLISTDLELPFCQAATWLAYSLWSFAFNPGLKILMLQASNVHKTESQDFQLVDCSWMFTGVS